LITSSEVVYQGLHVDVTRAGVIVDGRLVSPFELDGFVELFGHPRWSHDRVRPVNDTRPPPHAAVWDDIGVVGFVSDRLWSIGLRLCRDEEWEQNYNADFEDEWPSSLFSGVLTVRGKPVMLGMREKLSRWTRAVHVNTGDYRTSMFLTAQARLMMQHYAGTVPPPPGDPFSYLSTTPEVFNSASIVYTPSKTPA